MKTISQFGGVLLALFLCLFLMPVPAGAEDGGEEIGDSGVYWSLDDGTLTISGTGPMPADYSAGQWPWDDQRDIIRAVTIEVGVTSIGDAAFSDCKSLTSIKIPASVTSIGNYAFDNCTWLTSIKIPASVTSIGCYAFHSCSASKWLPLARNPS